MRDIPTWSLLLSLPLLPLLAFQLSYLALLEGPVNRTLTCRRRSSSHSLPTCPPGCTQLGTVSWTMVGSFDDDDDDDDNSSLLVVIIEFDDSNGLSSINCFKLLVVGTFKLDVTFAFAFVVVVDDDDELFCRLFICFRS
jgi:hypothetical protein